MVLFDIPLLPNDEGYWTLLHEGRICSFSVRVRAIGFATDRARESVQCGQVAFVNIEGEDGKWRIFRTDLKAPLDERTD